MVKALHRAGIEVILDVVFNHTAEGGNDGPTLCYRGLANDFYYILEKDKSRYADYTGCGNTLNANQPIVRRLIQDSLRYWVSQMHVDGFRFDLASILSRDEAGSPLPNPPVLWDIESDPLLAGTKLIAEAWDAAGLYQVGTFVGDTWQEWNGRFRYDLRRFLKGENSSVSGLATRLLGSPDIYGQDEREAEQSINFVTCHDGFTLNDLVSYNEKHNEANGENNRDGSNDNLSWNCGAEGPTDDPAIEAVRDRQVKNFLALLLVSVGTPMEALAAAAILREGAPDLKLRFVNVVDLFKLQPAAEHPHGSTDREFDGLFTTDKPIIFNFHGYPWLIHKLSYRFKGHDNMHVRGYKEKGNINTPLELAMLNETSRFDLVLAVIDRVPKLGTKAAHLKEEMKKAIADNLNYAHEHGTDRPEIVNWSWPY